MKSSSHLTRAVFRAIINNRPYAVAECRRLRTAPISLTKPLVPYTQRRTRMFGAIFGTLDKGFEGAKNTPKNLELALGTLVDLVRARRTQSRGPSDDQVLDAFRFLIFSRLESQRRLTRNEVYIATEVFKHFQENGLITESPEKARMGTKDLDDILTTLAMPSEKEKFRSDMRALATMVFAALPSRTDVDTNEFTAIIPVYATILARTGSALDAIALLKKARSQESHPNIKLQMEILKGLAHEGRKKEFDTIMQAMSEQLGQLSATEYKDLVIFLASNDNFEEAKRVYAIQLTHQIDPSTDQLVALLHGCIRAKQFEYGQSIARALERQIDQKGALETLFVWTASVNPSAEKLEQEMARLSQMASPETLTMSPFNALVDCCLHNQGSGVITTILDFARSKGLQADAETYSVLMHHEIRRGDLVSATALYEKMIRLDSLEDNEDLVVLNQFVAALAFSSTDNYNLLMRVIDNMLERNADFDTEALAGICRVFLQRDELEDITGLLRHRVDFYPAVDRQRISAIFQEFIRDPAVKDQRAYNAYELFRVAFPETPVEQRLPLMQSFFDRNRSDLACLVFGHMRQREDIEARPTADAYAHCFTGIAQCRDVDGLQMVYNMLKLDLEVELSTKVRNGLMLAYIACQMPYTAMIDHFWKIMDSREGPTYSTFEIALRACESWIPQGGYEARKIMAIVQAWNLEVTKELYDNYVGAIAGQSEFENTIELIEEMTNEIGEQPDEMTIGTFYNAIPWQYRKDEVERWAKTAYPDLWEELQKSGDEIDEEWEVRYFKIDRSIDINDPPLFGDGQYDARISRKAVEALEPPPESATSADKSAL